MPQVIYKGRHTNGVQPGGIELPFNVAVDVTDEQAEHLTLIPDVNLVTKPTKKKD